MRPAGWYNKTLLDAEGCTSALFHVCGVGAARTQKERGIVTARQLHARAARTASMTCRMWQDYCAGDLNNLRQRKVRLDRYMHIRSAFMDTLFSLTELAERHERGR